ncbi:3250_t:CDS:2, partial [Scutellospora calospora]
RFYPYDLDQELSLSEFENENIVLATRNFHIIEDINKNSKKYPFDSNDILVFPILINITALVQEDSKIEKDN